MYVSSIQRLVASRLLVSSCAFFSTLTLFFLCVLVTFFPQSTLTLTLTGETCTALKAACPSVSPEVLFALGLPHVAEQTGAAAAAAASTTPVQLQTQDGVYVQPDSRAGVAAASQGFFLSSSSTPSAFLQVKSLHDGKQRGELRQERGEQEKEKEKEEKEDDSSSSSFLQLRGSLEGDARLTGLAKAAAKLGVKTTEKLMEQVRLQEKVQREAMEAVFDLIQVEEKTFQPPSSFLGNENRASVVVFATSPEVS